MAITLRKEEEKDEPTGGGGKYLMNRLLAPPQEAHGAGLAPLAVANTAPPSIANPVHNKAKAVENIATRQAARRELAGQSAIALHSQQFPIQDITDARHATPFVAGEVKAPVGVVENFKYGMLPPGGQTFEQVSAGSANLPPADLVGRSLGNVARAVRGAVGINPPVSDTSQRFPSDLDAAVAAAPRPMVGRGSGIIARDFLTQVASPGQPHNKQRHLDNIAARRGGRQIVVNAPDTPDSQNSLSYNAGKFAREQVVPAIDSAARGAVGIATLVPRALYRAGSDAIRGFTGEAPNTEEFSVMPFNSPVLPGSRGAANAASVPATVHANIPAPVANQAGARGMIPIRQAEQTNPAPVVNAAAGQAPGPGDTSLSPIHARADSRIPPVAGGVPGGAFSVNLSPQDQQLKANLAKIDAMISGGVVPTPEQAQQIQELKQQAGFLRGGTDRRPVGRDGLPIKAGGGAGVGGNYSVQGSPEMVARFNSAVSPSEYSPEAQAARDKMHEQFLARNGKAKSQLTELEQIIGKPLDHFDAEVQPEIIKAAVGGMSAKGANEAAMANAKSNAEYRGGMLDAKGALLDAKMREMDLRGEMKDKEIAARGALKAQMSPSDEANVHKAIAEISFGGVNENNVESINALRARLGQPPLIKAKVNGEIKYVPGAPSSTGNGAQAKASADDWLKDF